MWFKRKKVTRLKAQVGQIFEIDDKEYVLTSIESSFYLNPSTYKRNGADIHLRFRTLDTLTYELTM